MEGQAYICTTCGVQYQPSLSPPLQCFICEDERQYVNPKGQSWTILEQINKQHKNIIEFIAPDIFAVYTTPSFAIGQRAHLLLSANGNILWDCITNLDASTIHLINALGGIKAMAISHPHYYSTIIEWSKAFGNVPVYVHTNDAQWLTRKSSAIHLWEGTHLDLWDGMQLICCGGHFPGASVLYVPKNNGALFVGDTIQVSPDLKTVSFMYSYPNLIPLPKKEILQIQDSVKRVKYKAMYGAFGKYILENAADALAFSVQRYLSVFK